MKNPFPEYGEIREISYHANYDIFSFKKYPDEYRMLIKYNYHELEYACLDLTEDQVKELSENIFKNASFERDKSGWPVNLIFKDFTFRLLSVSSVFYKDNKKII